MGVRGVGLVGAGLAAALLLGACTSAAEPVPRPEDGREPDRAAESCGPPSFAQIRGRVPRYVPRRLSSFRNDHSLCGGLWLPRAMADFTPQGLAVDGRTAYVSGYDGGGGLGTRLCRVLEVDLDTGQRLAGAGPIEGNVGRRPDVVCRHGGGMLLDRHGLWLVETGRLWLLDPDTLAVRRAWALIKPVRGSFAVHDDRGRLGLGGFKRKRAARLFWFDPGDFLPDGVLDLTVDGAVGSERVPPRTQGAVWGDLGPGRPGVWFASSTTYCGMLTGPNGARRGFLPGAEGMVSAGRGRLWVLSESATRPYQRQGGRPVVPMLARFDVSDGVDEWRRPDCTP